VATRSSGMGAARARIVVTSGVGDGGGHRKTPAEDRACRSCGEVFTPGRRDAAYCGPTCRQRAYRALARREVVG
jgi:hypothetical protein